MVDLFTRTRLRQAPYERACWWLALGVDLVPLKPGSKQLQPGYGPSKSHITDLAFAAPWFLNTEANLGVVLGPPTGLAVADWDDGQTYQAWLEVTGDEAITLTEQTARGYHSFFIAPGLSSAAQCGCEFKTCGVCMVSPSCHPSGVIYRLVRDVPLRTLDVQSMHTLFPSLSENLSISQELPRSNTDPARNSGDDRATNPSLVARIKAAYSIVAEMNAANIQLKSGGAHVLIGLCPFHDDHSPSLWVNPESGIWGCNKPTCPASGFHDVINFQALIRGISNQAAIRQMADELL